MPKVSVCSYTSYGLPKQQCVGAGGSMETAEDAIQLTDVT